jgi:hypothetical protein
MKAARIVQLMAMSTLMLAGSACAMGGRRGGKSTAPEFYGRVVRVQDTDTVPVANAKVWTAPFSADVTTDSTGYFSIRTGLVPGDYTVFAELQGVKGEAKSVPAKLGKSEEVFVMLGADETAWPPSQAFDKLRPKLTKGPGAMRRGS